MFKLQFNRRKVTDLIVVIILTIVVSTFVSIFLFKQLNFSVGSSILLATVGLICLYAVIGLSLFQPRIAFSLFVILFSLFVQLRFYLHYNLVGHIWITPISLILVSLLIGSIPYLHKFSIYREDVFMICFVIISLLPVIWARDLNFAILGYEQAILQPFIAYFLVRVLFSSEKGLTQLILVIGLSVTATILYLTFEAIRSGGLLNIVQAQTIRSYKTIDSIFRAGYGEPIAIAAIFMYIWPVIFFMYKWKWHSKWMVVMFQLLRWIMPLLVVITISRRHFVILLFTTITLIFWSYKYRILSWKIITFLFLGGSFVLILFLPNYIQRFTVGNGTVSDPNLLGGIPMEFSTARYVAEHISAVKTLATNPQGIGGFNGDYYWELYNPVPTNFGWIHLRQISIFIPYLEIGVHYGWLALMIFILYLLRLLRVTWKYTSNRYGKYKYLAAGLFTSYLWNGLLESMGINVSFLGDFENLPVNAFAIWAFMLFAIVPILHTVEKENQKMDREI